MNQGCCYLSVNLLIDRITLGRLDGIFIFGRGHSGDFLKLLGKILDGSVTQLTGSICQAHFPVSDIISGHTDTHLTEVFHGSHPGLFSKDSLKVGTSDGELFTDGFHLQMLGYMFRVIISNTFEEKDIPS